jgi:glyoxylase-like metal-dependent hydrolase (beta-lactamase superfamily II)
MAERNTVLVRVETGLDQRIRVFRRDLNLIEDFAGQTVDTFVVFTDRYVVICDTLLCAADMEVLLHEIASALAGRQLLVVNSHSDFDHCWGNSYFTGEHAAPIIGHDLSRTKLLTPEAQEIVAEFQHVPQLRDIVLTPPTITFAQSLTIDGGDLTLEFFHAPGHQDDHIALWISELRLLLAFDAVEKPLPSIAQVDLVPAMFQTLALFVALQPEHVLCSHTPGTDPTIIAETAAYLREIERRCRIFLRDHQPSDEELENAAASIDYPFSALNITVADPSTLAYYQEVHPDNVRRILQSVRNTVVD